VPVYEYEPLDHDCLMCEGRVDVIQGIREEALKYCPWCGLGVKRVVSRATIKLSETVQDDKAGKKGFTTFKRAEKGVWEKVSGAGPDVLAGTKEQIAQVEAEKKPPKKVIDLDKDPS
jgi:predicted nucleic acid-binding Zn ribbon protein